jgi:RNA polymerase sigma-70 factor (ECF subfamily)
MGATKQEIFNVLKAQSGDKVALDELFQSIQLPLYRYILSLVEEPSLAEDVLQEAFVLIYRKIYWLREPQLFRAWAYRIANREAFKWLEKEKRWSKQIRDESIMEDIVAPSADEKFEPELEAYLPQLLSDVSPASRSVIVLHYMHEMSLDEVAEVLGIAVGTAKSRLAYGLQSLRKMMKERGMITVNETKKQTTF